MSATEVTTRGPAREDVDRAQAAGWRVLERMRDHEDLTGVWTPHPMTGEPSQDWHPLSWETGDLAVALTWSLADALAPDEGWDVRAHTHAERAVAELARIPALGPGLFSGTAGLAFALRALSRGGTRYQRAIHDVDALLLDRIDAQLARLPGHGGLASADYDVISGLAGAGLYVAQTGAARGPLGAVAARVVRACCRWLDVPRPGGLWTPPEKITAVEAEHHHDLHSGYTNCGYAHGLAGVLSFLGVVSRRGLGDGDVRGGVQQAVAQLQAAMVGTEFGVDVPYHVVPGRGPGGELTRTAWCYGNPGAALALGNAAAVEPDAAVLAGRLMAAVRGRPAALRFVDNPSLCHGLGGLLLIERHLAEVLGDPELSCTDTLPALLEYEDPGAGFGFRNVQAGSSPHDSPGYLEGSGGVAVALLTAGRASGRPTAAEALITGAVLDGDDA